jgi:hypothetical protein
MVNHTGLTTVMLPPWLDTLDFTELYEGSFSSKQVVVEMSISSRFVLKGVIDLSISHPEKRRKDLRIRGKMM